MLLLAAEMLRPCVPLPMGVSTHGETGTTENWDEAETKEARCQKRLMHLKAKVLSNCSVDHSSQWPSQEKVMSTHGKREKEGSVLDPLTD